MCPAHRPPHTPGAARAFTTAVSGKDPLVTTSQYSPIFTAHPWFNPAHPLASEFRGFIGLAGPNGMFSSEPASPATSPTGSTPPPSAVAPGECTNHAAPSAAARTRPFRLAPLPPHLCERWECYQRALADGHMPAAVAAITALFSVIEKSEAATTMQLEQDLELFSEHIRRAHPENLALRACTRTFLQYVAHRSVRPASRIGSVSYTDSPLPSRRPARPAVAGGAQSAGRSPAVAQGRSAIHQRMLTRGSQFLRNAKESYTRIAAFARQLFYHGCTVLTHGYSAMVDAVFKRVRRDGILFTVYVTESRSDISGYCGVEHLHRHGIPTKFILDAAVTTYMPRIDFVLSGAAAITESGGLISRVGTRALALLAQAAHVPFYVAVQSYKFSSFESIDQTSVAWDASAGASPIPPIFLEAMVTTDTKRKADFGYFSAMFSHTQAARPRGTIAQSSLTPSRGQSPAIRRHAVKAIHCMAAHQVTGAPMDLVGCHVQPARCLNPLIDITPAPAISLIITENGIITPSAAGEWVLLTM